MSDGRQISGVLDLVASDRIDLDTDAGPVPVDVRDIVAYAIVSKNIERA
ncbi:MAG TPA: hypothetical protein VIK38_02725 [Coriobacteriia bacterium]